VPPPLTPDGDVSDQPRRLQGGIFARNLLMKSKEQRRAYQKEKKKKKEEKLENGREQEMKKLCGL
jgi:hypothetical protein